MNRKRFEISEMHWKAAAFFRIGLGGLLTVSLAVGGCGEAQTSAGRHQQVIGGSREGAPLILSAASDRGILEDLTTYQPAKPPIELRGTGQARRVEEPMGGDVQAESAAAALVRALQEGNVDSALRLFNPDHVAALTEEQRAELYPTFEKLELLRKTIEAKVASEAFTMMKFMAPLVQVVNPDQASVTPNLARLLLGPVQATPALTLRRQGDLWLFQLDRPLTTESAAQVLAFHKKLQMGLDRLIDWADQASTIEPAQLAGALAALLAGQVLDLPGPAESPPQEPPAVEPAPEDHEP